MRIRVLGGGTAIEVRRSAMWSEDPGKTLPKTEKPKVLREHERVHPAPLRWFFGFDGWRLEVEEDEFVLA
jgi:hypothetical protein